jgi:exopolysaccharide production protein ExoZ
MALIEESQRSRAGVRSGAEHDSFIEALRGLAAILVLISHYVVFVREGAGVWGMAATGVDLFFVLSGFVFAQALGRTGWALGPYLVRRFFRLYPLYVAALLLFAFLRPEAQRWDAWWAHLLMLHTTDSVALAAYYNIAFWSLPPEVEFYLLLPLLAGLLAVLSRRTAFGLWWLLGLALLVRVVLVAMAQPGEPPDTLRGALTVHLPGLLVEFMLGSMVAVAVGKAQSPNLGARWSIRACRWAAAFGFFLGLALVVVYEHHFSTPDLAAQASTWLSGHFSLLAALAYALMILGLGWSSSAARPNTPLNNTILSHLALWAGRLSYGVYLFHNAAPVLARRWWPELGGWSLVLVCVALTMCMAWVLHLLVEAPCRAYGRSLASRWRKAA